MVDSRRLIMPVAIRGLLAREWLSSRIVYNPLADAFHQNPYPKYARLRGRDPLHWSHLVKGWVLTRHEDCDEVLRDYKRWSNAERLQEGSDAEPALANDAPSMLFVDPPDHTRLRGLVNKAFTPRAIEQLKPRIAEIVTEIIESLPEDEPVDLMEVLAFPVPVIVIAEMLGVPAADRDDFKRWSDPVARTLEPTITPEETKAAQAAFAELSQYFEQIVAERAKEPREDLVSALIAAEESGDRLSHGELLSTLRLLLVAGNETTTNLIGNGMLALLNNPDELERLRQNMGLMENAVEELLRYDSPVQTDGRTALEDVEMYGKTIRKGQRVLTLLGSANRDPRVFANPNKLDIGREEIRHLAFARGIHHCLGAPLARAEGQAVFRALLETFPRIELAEAPRYKDHVVLRGLKSLRVRLHRS